MNKLSYETEIQVRFNDVDALGIVWHGHYVRYFEDAREAFGKKYGISYLDFYHQGLAVPFVSINCEYKSPIKYGDTVVVETTFIDTLAAKIKFDYTIYKHPSREIVATGSTVQVFVDVKTFLLQLTMPVFFEQWKEKWGVGGK